VKDRYKGKRNFNLGALLCLRTHIGKAVLTVTFGVESRMLSRRVVPRELITSLRKTCGFFVLYFVFFADN
jgi:hypothetical protein